MTLLIYCPNCKKQTENQPIPIGLTKNSTNDLVITSRCIFCDEFKVKKLSDTELNSIPDEVRNLMQVNVPCFNQLNGFEFANIIRKKNVNVGEKLDLQESLSNLPGFIWSKYPKEKHFPGYQYLGPSTRLDIRVNENNQPKPGEEPISETDQ